MERFLYVCVAIAGVAVIIARQHFVKSSAQASQDFFGRDVREGSGKAAFHARFTQVLAVVVGGALIVLGLLGTFGVIWHN
jgi:hypothetical protein